MPTKVNQFLLTRSLSVLAVSFLLGSCLSLLGQQDYADSWPNFRGPTHNGTSDTANPPTEWSEEKNIKWKVELPGPGNNSSPIVWGDKVFVTTAISEPAGGGGQQARPQQGRGGARGGRGGGRGGRGRGGRQRPSPTPTKFMTICLDRNSGEILWEKLAVDTTPHEGVHPDHSYASASPVTDGTHVYSHFGSRGLFCYDLDGNLKWKKDDFGKMSTRGSFGEGSSPFLHKDTIVVPWDHEGQSFVIALDAKTGETKWKNDRDEPSNWVTPVIVEQDGKSIVVTGGENYARAYDLESGDELWKASGFTSRPVSAPVVHNNLVMLASSRQGAFLSALEINGEGNLKSKWVNDRSAPDIPSLMLSEDRVFFVKGSTNVVHCLNAETGKEVFAQSRLPGIGSVYASPVAGGGKVIVVGRGGAAVVLEDSDEFKVLAENKLDDRIDATPALAGNQLFLRGKKYLYCISE